MSEKFAVMANIGLVFEKSRDRFFAQLGWLILPTLVLAVVLIGLGAVFGGAMFSFLQSVQFAATTGNPNFLAIGGGLVIYFVILAIVLILFFSWYGIYASFIGTRALLGEPLQAGVARQRGFNRMISSLLVSIVLMLAYVAAYAALLLLVGLLSALGVFGIAIAVLIGIGFVIVLFYVGLGLIAVTPIMANEGLGFSAISRSWDLADGNRWQLLGYNLMWILIFIAFYIGFIIAAFVSGLLMAASVIFGMILIGVAYLAFIFIIMVVSNLIGPAAYLGLLRANGENTDEAVETFA